MNKRISYIAVFGSVLVAFLGALFFPFIEDPVYVADSFETGDNREARLGDLSYEQTIKLQNAWRKQTQNAKPSIRCRAIGQLATIYRERKIISTSLHWVKVGLKQCPNDPHIKKEETEMKKIILRNISN